jgi:integrase
VVTNLTGGDVDVDDREVRVTIRFSKTDQDAKGTKVYVPAGTDPLTDPVRWLRAWLAVLGERDVLEGPLFRALTPTGRFQNRDRATKSGDQLTGKSLNAMVKRRAKKAGLPNKDDVTAHGLRRGAATELAESKATEEELADAGRWARGSTVPKRRYIVPAQGSGASALRRIKGR